MASFIEQIADQQRVAGERHNKRREIALKNGLIWLQVSPRRYLVAKIRGYGGLWGVHKPTPTGLDITYRTDINAEVVFGPDTYAACQNYIAENTEPLPKEVIG